MLFFCCCCNCCIYIPDVCGVDWVLLTAMLATSTATATVVVVVVDVVAAPCHSCQQLKMGEKFQFWLLSVVAESMLLLLLLLLSQNLSAWLHFIYRFARCVKIWVLWRKMKKLSPPLENCPPGCKKNRWWKMRDRKWRCFY